MQKAPISILVSQGQLGKIPVTNDGQLNYLLHIEKNKANGLIQKNGQLSFVLRKGLFSPLEKRLEQLLFNLLYQENKIFPGRIELWLPGPFFIRKEEKSDCSLLLSILRNRIFLLCKMEDQDNFPLPLSEQKQKQILRAHLISSSLLGLCENAPRFVWISLAQHCLH